MINHRRWVALLLCAVMTFSSATVLAAEETTSTTEPEALEAQELTEVNETEPPEYTEPAETVDAQTVTEPTAPVPEGVKLILNGAAMAPAVNPTIFEGNTFVSLPAFAAAMGCQTEWAPNGILTVTRGEELHMEVLIGSDLVSVNDRFFYMPDICRLMDRVPMVPIRGLAKVFSLTIGWDGPTQTVTLAGGEILAWGESFYNADDLLWLSRIIHAESRGESLEGKIAVGNVVLNRVRSSRFPDTIYDVIFQGNGTQFSPVRSGKIYNEPTEECIKAAKLCLEGANEVEDALYFLNVSISGSSWAVKNRTLVAKIGCHSFFS